MYFPIVFVLLSLAAFQVQGVEVEKGDLGRPRCPSRDGAYPVYIPHKDCSKFWECSNGKPYLFNCPANLHFNRKLNVCDWPQNAGCRGNGDGDNSGGSGDSSSSSESKE